MNIAVIFAGGWGERMNNQALPKQFMEYRGKPIIIYTLEIFDSHPQIDCIVIACIKEWITYLHQIINRFGIKKVRGIVPGGVTGQDSIYNGLSEAKHFSHDENDIVLIHDGVRPLINNRTVSDNISKVQEVGSCITCSPTIETFVIRHAGGEVEIPSRENSIVARAPQSFLLKDILAAHEMARRDGRHDFIDSCTMMHHYGYKLSNVIGPTENIKITTPIDFCVFKAILEAKEAGRK